MVTRFSSDKLDAQLKAANPDGDYNPSDPALPLEQRLMHVTTGPKSDRCKTAILLWEDTFRRSKWLQNCMVALVTGTVAVLIVTLVIALVSSSLVAGITGAVGAVVTGAGAVFVRSERDKSIKLLDRYTNERKLACK